MARNKYPENTINKILDVSLNLFIEKGYDKTTIKDIVDNLNGLSRGAIYHHFKSKEEIIDAVTTRLFEEQNPINKIKSDDSINGLQKLKRVFIASVSNQQQKKLLKSSPSLLKNPKILAMQINNCITVYAPLINEIIMEGVNDGSIKVSDSKELSEVIMILLNIWINPSVVNVTKVEFTNKIVFIKKLFDSLGLPVIDSEVMLELREFRDAVFA